MKKINQINQKK